MIFNSLAYAVFLPVFFLLYWLVAGRSYRAQNMLIVVASYIFYGWWDWRFVSLLVFSSALDYGVGLLLAREQTAGRKKALLLGSCALSLGILAVFKYYDFFAISLAAAASRIGIHLSLPVLRLILPVGISFYTFHSLSYIIDIWRGKTQPTRDVVAYFAFVSFFPLLVAGPIVRSSQLLPQMLHPRSFSITAARDALRQMLWGFFKKMVIADNCAFYVNELFKDPQHHSSADLVLGAFYFTVQIYCDFSGYSDIAAGTARLLGFSLPRNFACPYFSKDIREFWRRWHISLSSWFRDYVFIPLGGSREGRWRTVRNILVTFLLSGLWHGANLTFVLWGLAHALLYLLLPATGEHNRRFPALLSGLLTFALVNLTWVLFRAPDATTAFNYFGHLFSALPDFAHARFLSKSLLLLILFLFGAEWLGRGYPHVFQSSFLRWPVPLRWSTYLLLVLLIYVYGGKEQTFIYFQF